MEKIAYFDNAATTFPKPDVVYSFMDNFYRTNGVNVGRGQNRFAEKANLIIHETRTLLLSLMHSHRKLAVFTHSATEAINIILRGMPLLSGSHIYLSPFEHNAVTRVINFLAKQRNLSIHILAYDKTSNSYDMQQIKRQFLMHKPNLVVTSHASNVFGIVAPIKEICSMSKEFDAINVVDMCQTMGLIDFDLSCDNIDYAVFSGHKYLYGPFGVAGFICGRESNLSPLIYGGTGVDSLNDSMPSSIPEKFEVASVNIHAISGLHASLAWLSNMTIAHVSKISKTNHRKLIDLLREYKNIRILSPIDEEHNIGVVSCVFDRYSVSEIGYVLSNLDVIARTGLHCAPFAHKFWGTAPEGTVRFSVSYFTTSHDFERLSHAFEHIHNSG